jgi:hypothetical protein
MRGLSAGGAGVKWEAIPVNVPFLDEERHLVLIEP